MKFDLTIFFFNLFAKFKENYKVSLTFYCKKIKYNHTEWKTIKRQKLIKLGGL